MVKYCPGNFCKKKKRKFRWIYNRYPGAPRKKVSDPNNVIVSNSPSKMDTSASGIADYWLSYLPPYAVAKDLIQGFKAGDIGRIAKNLGGQALTTALTLAGGPAGAAVSRFRGIGSLFNAANKARIARIMSKPLHTPITRDGTLKPMVQQMYRYLPSGIHVNTINQRVAPVQRVFERPQRYGVFSRFGVYPRNTPFSSGASWKSSNTWNYLTQHNLPPVKYQVISKALRTGPKAPSPGLKFTSPKRYAGLAKQFRKTTINV